MSTTQIKKWLDDGAPRGEYISPAAWHRRHGAAVALRAELGTGTSPEPGDIIEAWRATNRAGEHDDALTGAMLRSTDHSGGSPEAGLSVATGLHYAARGYRYCYRVRGRVVGLGADGEPVIADIVCIGDLLTADKAVAADWREGGEAHRRQQIRAELADQTGASIDDLLWLEGVGP